MIRWAKEGQDEVRVNFVILHYRAWEVSIISPPLHIIFARQTSLDGFVQCTQQYLCVLNGACNGVWLVVTWLERAKIEASSNSTRFFFISYAISETQTFQDHGLWVGRSGVSC